uniref:Ribosome biogenesis protein NOP53 n=1 Tax=Panagrellus redivivus TaxID=6233 RepID=A0A7E4VIS5_PANRE
MDGKDQSANRTVKKSGWKKLYNKFKKSKESQETNTTNTTNTNVFDDSNTDNALASNGSTVIATGKPKKAETEAAIEPQAAWVSSKKSDKSKKRSKKSVGTEIDASTSVKKAQSLDQISTRQPRKKTREKDNETMPATTIDESMKTTSLKSPSSRGRARAEAQVRRKKSDNKTKKSKDDDLDRSLSRSFQRGLRTFRDNRAKEFRSVKTFISRQYNPDSMQKVVKQVEARQKRNGNDIVAVNGSSDRPSSSLMSTKLHQGDDVFPTRKNRKSNREKGKSKREQQPKSDQKTSEMQAAKLTEDGHVLVETNNNNDGELFVAGGRPFWQQVGKGRGSEDDEDDEITDDELPMNAEIILELDRGKISLTEMPRAPVLLDPYASVAHLDSHDKLFFTRDLIFSNTVRSMINLNDDTTEVEKKKRHGVRRLVKFDRPHGMNRYRRNDKGDFVFDNPENPPKKE